MSVRPSVRRSVRRSVGPSVPRYFQTLKIEVFECGKSSNVINNDDVVFVTKTAQNRHTFNTKLKLYYRDKRKPTSHGCKRIQQVEGIVTQQMHACSKATCTRMKYFRQGRVAKATSQKPYTFPSIESTNSTYRIIDGNIQCVKLP